MQQRGVVHPGQQAEGRVALVACGPDRVVAPALGLEPAGGEVEVPALRLGVEEAAQPVVRCPLVTGPGRTERAEGLHDVLVDGLHGPDPRSCQGVASVEGMQLGVHYANFTHPDWEHRLAERLTETARVADQGGAAQFTVMDHWFQMENLGGPPEPMLEGYTTLGYLAAITEHVRLSLLVTGVTYRHPGLLAKTVTTLDVLSGGRAMLGIGAAWYDREHAGLGVPFPPLKERFERLEEALQVCLQMWGDETGAYDGAHYRLAETVNVPPAVQRLSLIHI